MTTGASTRARAGGGALVDLAPHGIDLVGTLLGGDDLDTLDVVLQRRVHAYPVDDGAVLARPHRRAASCSPGTSPSTPPTRSRAAGWRSSAPGPSVVAEDTMGQTAGGQLTLTDATGVAADVAGSTPTTSPFAGQLAAFSAAVAGTAGWPWPLERDLRLHRLLHDAIARASERSR